MKNDKKKLKVDKNQKIEHKGKKVDQGGDCCPTSSMPDLVGRGRALKKDPSHKSHPGGGPFSSLGQKGEQGEGMTMTEPSKTELTKVKK